MMPAGLPGVPGQATRLIVVSPGCAPCHDLLRDLARDADAGWPVVISTGDAAATRAVQDETGLPPDVALRLADYDALRAAWGVTSTPTTLVLDAEGRFVQHAVGYDPAAPALVGAAG